MPSFLPRSAQPVYVPLPVCADVEGVFQDPQCAGILTRVIDYLHRIYLSHSDGSFERISRPGVVTEQFFLFMPTVDAYKAEIELLEAIREHALGNSGKNSKDENVKLALQKYLDTHIFVYREIGHRGVQEIKSGDSKRTHWREVDLLEVSAGIPPNHTAHIGNAIQIQLFLKLEAKSGNNAQYRVSQL